jgi:hypothetical protein
MTNNTKEVSASYHFKYGNETLLKCSIGAKELSQWMILKIAMDLRM